MTADFSWRQWRSRPADVKGLGPHLAASMLFDVYLIHEFEHALLRLKNDDCVWGPVHTSVGQEAVAAGAVAALRPTDKFLATHRAHHQFLTKVFHHAVARDWSPIAQEVPAAGRTAIRRTLSEIMGLAEGYCGGRGGSMHLRCAEAGFLGSNAIVGGGIPIATGAALAEKAGATGGVVVCFIGDGAVNQGAFHEACNLAGLWRLPLIVFVENNEYAVATSREKACAVKDLVVRAFAYGMEAHVVDGSDPVAVYRVMRHTAAKVREGGAPCLIEAKCYRRYHHAGDQPGSAFSYRTKEEEGYHREREAVDLFPGRLQAAKVLTAQEITRIRDLAASAVAGAVDEVTEAGAPRRVRARLQPDTASVAHGVRSDGREWDPVRFSEREDFAEYEDILFSDGIAAVTGRWMERDPGVFVLGEEVGNFGGGAYGATKGLPAKYPNRVLNTPISEAGFVGLGLGAAMLGMRPVVEIMFCDFSLVAADQLFNQIGKARHMYGNTTDLPLVLRTRVCTGLGYGGQHSMDAVGLYAMFPGWRIVSPSSAFDYIGLFNSAMRSLDPVLILEHQALYKRKMPVPKGNLDYYIELGKARRVVIGSDVTILAYSSMVPRCMDLMAGWREAGLSPELIDLRTVDYAGIDYETIGASLRKTGAAVIVEEATESQSIGARVAKTIAERFFDFLDTPVACLTSLDVPPSVSRVLEAAALLSDAGISAGVTAVARRRR